MSYLRGATLVVALALAACSGAPPEQGLRDSFAAQLAANRFVKQFQRTGDDLTFVGPGPEGGSASWRVHIDSTVVDANDDPSVEAADREKLPYRGTVKSSWYADGVKIEPAGGESNLPFELMSNGLSQDCWAFWNRSTDKWSWE
jgi:hypothetical protein